MIIDDLLKNCGEEEKQAIIDDLLKGVSPNLLPQVYAPANRRVLLERALEIMKRILNQAKAFGLYEGKIDPGHGKGHIMRDYLNALRLFAWLQGDHREIFIGFLAGVLHDLGCTVVDRYSESMLVFRHAEMSAIVLEFIFQADDCGLNRAEQQLLQYAVMAHTHYLKPQTVTLADGSTREILPYKDMEADGTPWYFVWYPRWVDRLDCTGPCFPARHYLNLVDSHKDYSSEHGFYDVDFQQHMRPLLRSEIVGPLTMLEHMQMFANSMNNNSPYGKHDYGYMVTLRDEYTAYLREIIQAVTISQNKFAVANNGKWEEFLRNRIEPSVAGAEVAEKLENLFSALPLDFQWPWEYGFNAIQRTYQQWANRLVVNLHEIEIPWSAFPLLENDLQTII